MVIENTHGWKFSRMAFRILTLIVKLRISMPIRPTSGDATSLTSWAN